MKPKQLITGALTTCLLILFCFLQLKAQRLNLPAPSNLQIDSVSSVFSWSSPVRNTSCLPELRGYQVFLDGADTAFTKNTAFTFPYLVYNHSYTAGLCAVFSAGNSDTVELDFTSLYLPAPHMNCSTFNWDPPVIPVDSIPNTLIAYQIFRDGNLIEIVDPGTTEYGESDLQAGTYYYCIKAVFDLYPYGLPGEQGASLCSNECEVVVEGLELPFEETWESGSFDTNSWQHDNYWYISAQHGNPSPCAKFCPETPLDGYGLALTSELLETAQLSDGQIKLSFDIKLSNINPDSTEFLRVFLKTGEDMHLIEEFANDENMSEDWNIYTHDITDIALESDFRLMFKATGQMSSNIEGWYVDNVFIRLECFPPLNLDVEYEMYAPEWSVTWLPPGSVLQSWIRLHDNTFENEIASPDGGMGLAQRFYPNHQSYAVTKIAYFNSDSPGYEGQEEIYLLDETGENILSGPHYIVNAEPNSWVIIDVDSICIDNGGFMIATINTDPVGPSVGVDDSDYNGSLFYGCPGDWTELGELGNYYYVGSHKALIKYQVPNRQKELLGYDVYRKYYPADFQKINDVIVTDTFFVDNLGLDGDYWYTVSAVYDDCYAFSDTIWFYAGWWRLDENQSEITKIFPNPASKNIVIKSQEMISTILIHNTDGRKVSQVDNLNSLNHMIDVSGFENGVYILSLITESGQYHHKVLIHK